MPPFAIVRDDVSWQLAAMSRCAGLDAEEFLARVRRLIERTKPACNASADLRRLSALTQREREVLTLTTEGLAQKQIATRWASA